METSGSDYTRVSSGSNSGNDHHDGRFGRRLPGRALAGMIIVIVGSILLAKELGVGFPHWLTSWPMFMIGLGFYIGARHSFRNGGWIIPIIIGGIFLVDEIEPGMALHQYMWPAILIGAGLIMILRPKKRKDMTSWNVMANERNRTSSDDFLDSVSVFGGSKKNILSKDFKGGDIVMFFGGVELNLSQADIVSPITMEITAVFGGAKLIVPSNWRVKSEIVTVFASFEDKRQLVGESVGNDKVLILTGTAVFGGIDIKSY